MNLSVPVLSAGSARLSLARPQVMGVLNLTDDSFSDGGRLLEQGELASPLLRARAEQMVADGAAILDLGAESSRPGADPVPAAQEQRRILQALEVLADLPVMLSVDTRKPSVAAAAIRAGAQLVNDINGGRSQAMLEVVSESDAALCVMHMQGEPATMQQNPSYENVVREVALFLNQQLDACANMGIGEDRLLIDPGFGFGKTLEHNLALLRELPELTALRVPVLVGLSRKRMLGTLTGQPVDARLSGSLAAALIAVERGARIVRVHDVRETVDALAIWSAVETGVAPPGPEAELEAGS